MKTIANIFRTYGPQYIERFEADMPGNHRKVINAIMNCRTDAYGINFYQCDKCEEKHRVFRSCGNRHCPACQNHKTKEWLQKQMDRQLPGHHFMITFTVPEELRDVMRRNQRITYDTLFKTSSDAIKKLAADERFIGGDLPGFFGVLHTWGRTMNYHPHIHYIVPGGAISKCDSRWHPSDPSFYVPNRALSEIFKAKFRDTLKKENLFDFVPAQVWNKDWNVNIQPVGDSEHSIGYLAPYVFKVAITDSRIVEVREEKVTFRYKKGKSTRWRKMTLSAMEFIRRFLQNVLPTGFMKVRYFGFLHPGSSVSLKKVRALIELSMGFFVDTPEREIIVPDNPHCSSCGGNLVYLYSILPHEMTAIFNTG